MLPFGPEWIHDGWIAWIIVLYSRLSYLSEPLICYRIHTSQQVGVPQDSSFWQRINRARRAGVESQLLLARQFESLRNFWREHPTDRYATLDDDLKEKIRHSYLRAQLPSGKLRRFLLIVRNVSGYRRFSIGWISMAKDLLQQ